MFIDDYIIINSQIIFSFFGMLFVYLACYNLMKRNKNKNHNLKKIKWMAFGISLILVGLARVMLFSD